MSKRFSGSDLQQYHRSLPPCPKCGEKLSEVTLNILHCFKCDTPYYTDEFFKGGLNGHKKPKKKKGSQITSIRLKLFLLKHKEPIRLKAKKWQRYALVLRLV